MSRRDPDRPWVAPRTGGYSAVERDYRPAGQEITDYLVHDRPVKPEVRQWVDALIGRGEGAQDVKPPRRNLRSWLHMRASALEPNPCPGTRGQRPGTGRFPPPRTTQPETPQPPPSPPPSPGCVSAPPGRPDPRLVEMESIRRRKRGGYSGSLPASSLGPPEKTPSAFMKRDCTPERHCRCHCTCHN